LIGTCSWTDPTLLASGFYPRGVNSPEKRLQFYAQHFPVVEVDSSYYALPSERNAALWVERTPPDFTFDIKAFSLFTLHPTQGRALPRDLREALGERAQQGSLYYRDLPRGVREALWRRFEAALLPLDSAGKLGVILFQFPPWFLPGQESRDHILACRERLPQYRLAVEFRSAAWLSGRNLERTLGFLRENQLAFVAVDEPQGFRSSVPPVAEATAELALVRFHGRNRETWEKRGITATERFRYLYTKEELQEWVPRLERLAASTRQMHVLFNNCYGDYAVRNAKDMDGLLRPLGLEDREALQGP
jgi:uncharacterized protein YecE (DUF72 family)